MKLVDARGKTCPQPVILTKREVDFGENEIITIVDNETAKSNVIKFGKKLNFECKEEVKTDGIYITLTRGVLIDTNEVTEKKEAITVENKKHLNKGYVFGTDILGKGSDELGKTLMKGFIYTITETKPYPNYMIFLNSGVKLTASGSDSVEDLKKLEDAGVKIVSCGTCLDYYNIKDELSVGQVTNMYDIVETITNSDNAVMI